MYYANERTREEIKDELNDLINHMIEEFYQPQVNNLKARQPWNKC